MTSKIELEYTIGNKREKKHVNMIIIIIIQLIMG